MSEAGRTLAVIEDHGTVDLSHNWLKRGWVKSFAGTDGVLNDQGGNITGEAPGFTDLGRQDFHLAADSPVVDKGCELAPAVLPAHAVTQQYVKHQRSEPRPSQGAPDLGAYEFAPPAK